MHFATTRRIASVICVPSASVSHSGDTRSVDRLHRPPGLDQALRKPIVPRHRTEEVTGADNQRPAAAACVVQQALLHFDPDRALACLRMLGRHLRKNRERVWTVVVDRSGSTTVAPTAVAAAIVLSIMGSTSFPQFRYPGGFTA